MEMSEEELEEEGGSQENAEGEEEGEPLEPSSPPKPKGRFQKRIDGLTREVHEAKREAEYWRNQISNPIPAPIPVPVQTAVVNKPKIDDFESTEDYLEALAEYKFNDVRKKFEQENLLKAELNRLAVLSQNFSIKASSASAKYADFEAIALNQAVPYTPAMREVVFSSEVGIDLAYFLGKNMEEARRIASLPPVQAAREIGRIEARLSTAAKPRSSTAPHPIYPIHGGNETPPKNPEDMDNDEYQAWRRKKMRR